MKKQIFIAALALLSVAELPQLYAQKGKSLYDAPLGIAPYSFRRSFPNGVAATLDTIKSMGFTEIEGGGGRGMSPEEYRKLCDEKGLTIPSFGTGYDDLVKDPKAIADRGKILGAKYVMCAWIPHERGKFNLENAKK